MNSEFRIFVVDDDPDDQELVTEALGMTEIRSVQEYFLDGQELMDRLVAEKAILPDLILLDLNMPRVDGRTALSRIKSNDKLRHLPIVILTTSRSDDDVRSCYRLGANSFITKPARFEELVSVMEKVCEYWSEVVRRPGV